MYVQIKIYIIIYGHFLKYFLCLNEHIVNFIGYLVELVSY